MSNESDEFEKELEDFFKDRAVFRSATVSDSSKKTIKEIRKEEDAVKFPENPIASTMSGCCMTGCHNCPWGYQQDVELPKKV